MLTTPEVSVLNILNVYTHLHLWSMDVHIKHGQYTKYPSFEAIFVLSSVDA